MKRLCRMLLFAAVILLITAGCGPNSEEVSVTVQSQVASIVRQTVESRATATPASTYTPFPSLTPEATYTPYPTYTPQPTFTPQATYTPYPTVTFTPTAEDTATAVPTNTPVPQTVVQPTAVPPTIDNLSALKTEFANTLADIDLYRGSIIQQKAALYGRIEWRPVNCPENIAIHDRIVSTITLDVSQDIQVVQSAYATYLYAVNYFAEIMAPWNQGCQEAVANGDTTKVMDNFQRSLLLNEIATILSWLNPANDQLKQLGD